MSETSSRDVTGSASSLAGELRAIREELQQHNRTIRRSRRFAWALTAAFLAVTAVGIAGFIDDRNDDRRECRIDNANSVRDSEVLIEAVEDDLTPEGEDIIERYRENVRASLREC